MTILDEIAQHKRKEVDSLKAQVSLEKLKQRSAFSKPCCSLTSRLSEGSFPGIIAEFKRRSPSKAQIAHSGFNPKEIALEYESNGATGMSVLTDSNYFGGSNLDLKEAKSSTSFPILRKEFIVDPYQIYEAKSIGADVILLIAAILDKKTILEFTELAHELGLEVICEFHDKDELQKYNDKIDILGINNRNLKTFTVDYKHSKDIFPYLPEDCIAISESGLKTAASLVELSKTGYKGFLIGESFMSTASPGQALNKLIQESKALRHDS